jgi:hypothetical protein
MSNVAITGTHAQYELFMGVLGENLSDEARMLVSLDDLPELHAPLDDMLDGDPRDAAASFASPARLDVSDAGLFTPYQTIMVPHEAPPQLALQQASPPPPPSDAPAKWPSLDLNLALTNVSLSLQTDPEVAGAPALPLARFDFIDSSFSFLTWTDGTPADGGSEVSISSRRIIAHDLRWTPEDKPNYFPHVLQPRAATGEDSRDKSQAPPQLEITYRSSPDKALVNVILNEACVLFSLDWFLSVKQFLFTRAPNQLCAQPTMEPTVPRRERLFQLVVSITNPEFVLCVDHSKRDTDAVVLKFCSIIKFVSEPTAPSGASNKDTWDFDFQVNTSTMYCFSLLPLVMFPPALCYVSYCHSRCHSLQGYRSVLMSHGLDGLHRPIHCGSLQN